MTYHERMRQAYDAHIRMINTMHERASRALRVENERARTECVCDATRRALDVHDVCASCIEHTSIRASLGALVQRLANEQHDMARLSSRNHDALNIERGA